MLDTNRTTARHSHSEALDELRRCLLTCQLACIACAEADLRSAVLKANSRDNSRLIRACIQCVEACTALNQVFGPDGYRLMDLLRCLRLCIDACATCEAECLESAAHQAYAERCRSVCSKFADRCQQLLGS